MEDRIKTMEDYIEGLTANQKNLPNEKSAALAYLKKEYDKAVKDAEKHYAAEEQRLTAEITRAQQRIAAYRAEQPANGNQ